MPNSLPQIFKDFKNTKVLVLGDIMLDTYLLGESERISPEAPVPVVNIQRKESRLGGAANVAANIVNLGGEAVICSVIGEDDNGDALCNLLVEKELSTEFIFQSQERITTEKTRILSMNHQMLRYDQETAADLSDAEQTKLESLIDEAFDDHEFDVVIFQDYNKGILTKKIIASVIKKCLEKGIPTAVDPKKYNFFEFSKVTLFKPNLLEVKEALNMDINKNDPEKMKEVSDILKNKLGHSITLITLSEKGVFIDGPDAWQIVPAAVRNVSDVSGAGDTVISVAGMCLAQKLDNATMAILSNIAGGLACENVGVTPIDKDRFFKAASAALANESVTTG